MENASKALIIAGAILISIVLVSVGVLVVNSLNPDEGIDEMERQQIATFNSKIEGSTGNNKQGTVARQLISTIISNNSTYIIRYAIYRNKCSRNWKNRSMAVFYTKCIFINNTMVR